MEGNVSHVVIALLIVKWVLMLDGMLKEVKILSVLLALVVEFALLFVQEVFKS